MSATDDPPVIVINSVDDIPADNVNGNLSDSKPSTEDGADDDEHRGLPNQTNNVNILKLPAPTKTNHDGQKRVKINTDNQIAPTDPPGMVTVKMDNGNSLETSNDSPQVRKRHTSKEEEMRHLTADHLILAETLIKDAESGRNFTYKTDPKYVKHYIIYHRWYFRWGLYFCIFINLSLALFESPTRKEWEAPYWATMLVEVFCLLLFIARVVHCAYFTISTIFWRDTKNIMVIGIIVLTILDMITYGLWTKFAPDTHPVRWSRPLRSLLIINFSDGRQIRRAFRNIRRTVPEIVNVLILFMMSVLLFALLGLKLFGRRKSLKYPDGHSYFKNYFDSIWDLYVLVTTANNPDVMMPAYDESMWFAIYFGVYLIICLYVFMSIVLAAIYNNYRNNLKNEIRDAVFNKRRKLRQAFNILKITRDGVDIITKRIWNEIMSRVLPNKSINQIELLMTILDKDAVGHIKKSDFLNLVNLLQVPLTEVHERLTYLEKKFPDYYNSKASHVIRVIVRHRFFRFFFDFMIFLNAWFIGFDIDESDWFFLSIFMGEILLKLYVFGPKEFFRRLWNIFDFLVIFGAVIATAVESGDGERGEELSTLDLLLVLRVMRLIKIFVSIKRFRVIIMTIMNIGPSMATYGGVIFVLYYMFAIVGMEIFHGLITYHGYNETNIYDKFCGNPALKNTAFYRNHYCHNNFNDILKSFVLLFELTVVNQWHVLSSGFVFVTNKGARVFFILFHICCVVIVLNIFVAFILEAFILEYSLQKAGKFESAVESKIKELGLGIGQVRKDKAPAIDEMELVANEEEVDRTPPVNINVTNNEEEGDSDSDTDSIPDLTKEKGLKFHLKKRSRKKVEVLLQQMFEGEINPDDDGDEMGYYSRTRALTLDAVT
ncbi:Ion transport protein [Mactra antiquata]